MFCSAQSIAHIDAGGVDVINNSIEHVEVEWIVEDTHSSKLITAIKQDTHSSKLITTIKQDTNAN